MRKRLREALADEADDVRKLVVDKSEYWNEFQLYARLKSLLNGLDEATLRVITQDPDAFARRVVDTRNYYTHFGSRRQSFEDIDLVLVEQKLKSLIAVLLLKRVGVPEAVMVSGLRAGRCFQAPRAVI